MLQQLTAGQQQMSASLQQLTATVQQLMAGQQQQQARLQVMSQRDDQLHDMMARLTNSLAVRDDSALQPLSGDPPPAFPATRSALQALTRAQLGPLLQGYGLPNNGTTTAKRQRLVVHLGVVGMGV